MIWSELSEKKGVFTGLLQLKHPVKMGVLTLVQQGW